MTKNTQAIIPLAVPGELHKVIRSAVKDTRLSQADVMRQALYIGVPELVSRMRPKPVVAGK